MSDATPGEVGVVVGGALTKGLEIRLDPGATAQLGQYVMAPLDGGGHVVGMVTDVVLRAAESGPTAWPPSTAGDAASKLLAEVLQDTGVYTQAEASLYLEVPEGEGETSRARRLPRHFARVALADQGSIDRAFSTGGRPSIPLGTPLGMEGVDVVVDFEKLFERSAGIFGKSGTGKSVLALQLLDALVTRSSAAATNKERTVALVFDMHNDYGWEMKFQGGARTLRSLKGRHASAVTLYALDESILNADARVIIGTRDIEPEDLDVLQSTAYFTSNAVEAAHECAQRFGRDWIDELLEDVPGPRALRQVWRDGDEPDDVNWARVAARLGFHAGSMDNLRRGLRRIVRRDFVKQRESEFSGVIDHIVQTLQGGSSVVVQFGKDGRDLTSYMLVANMLSRRIWQKYSDRTERAAQGQAEEPNRLVIVIEEAHKFVDRALAGQSIFGQIARELRKYNVTLLVIDQRPSQIDPEVLSQIGTKFCLQLDSDNDVEALIGGVSGRAGLRQVIASLESRQQALAFGHALPMPVVVRTPEATDDTRRASLLERLGVRRPAGVEPTPDGLFGARHRPGAGAGSSGGL
ncbi:MAG: DUF87 domain-containing protein [Dehalococcoidia bacterium]